MNETDQENLVRETLAGYEVSVSDLGKLTSLGDRRFFQKRLQEPLLYLLDVLPLGRVKRCVLQGLARKEARSLEVSNALIEEMEALRPRIEDGDRAARSFAWSIADALDATIVDGAFDRVVELLHDRRLGRAREMLPLALSRIKRRRVETASLLFDALDDPDLTAHTIAVLPRLKATEAIPRIEHFLESESQLVRSEARRALKKLRKAAGIAEEQPPPRVNWESPAVWPDGSEGWDEASMSFDPEQIPRFLSSLSERLTGLDAVVMTDLVEGLESLEPEIEVSTDLELGFGGKSHPIRLCAKLDFGETDFFFFGPPSVVACVDGKMGLWLDGPPDEDESA